MELTEVVVKNRKQILIFLCQVMFYLKYFLYKKRKQIFIFLCLAIYFINCFQYKADIYSAFYELIPYTIISIVFWGMVGGVLIFSSLLLFYFSILQYLPIIDPEPKILYVYDIWYRVNAGLLIGIFFKLIFNIEVHNFHF
jgi:hypothetical protein